MSLFKYLNYKETYNNVNTPSFTLYDELIIQINFTYKYIDWKFV